MTHKHCIDLLYFDQELLYNKHLYMDGQKLETTGFQLTKPQLTEELLRQVRVRLETITRWLLFRLCSYGCESNW